MCQAVLQTGHGSEQNRERSLPLGAHMLGVWRVRDGFQCLDLAAWGCHEKTEGAQEASLNSSLII